VWVADNAHRIKDSGAVNQITLALVRVAFIEFWLANAVGALLLHGTTLEKSIAWEMSTASAFPVLGSLVAMVLVQSFFPGRKPATNPELQPQRQQLARA
jgi:hypothetical protein